MANPKPQSASGSNDLAGGKKGKKGGGLIGLVKRKPLETIGAAAAVVAIVLYLRSRNNAAGQSPPGGSSYLAPAGQPVQLGDSSGFQNEIAGLQRQIDALDQARHPHPHQGEKDTDDKKKRRRPPPRGHHGGGPPPTNRHRHPRRGPR